MTDGADGAQPSHAMEAQPFHLPQRAPSPPSSGGEGWGEGGVRQGRSCRNEGILALRPTRESAETTRNTQTRGAPPSSQPSLPKGGEGARCDKWRVLSVRHGVEALP
jgi:hypothetical protein